MVDDADELSTLPFTSSLGIAFEETTIKLQSATFARKVLLLGVTLVSDMGRSFHISRNYQKKHLVIFTSILPNG